MKTQAKTNRHTFFLLFLLLSITLELVAQEVIEKDGSYYYINDHVENFFKSRHIPESGSKKHWPAHHLIPVKKQQAESLSTKSDEEWNIQRVHSGKFFTEMSDRSLAMGSGGNPHIAYGGKHLYYAWYNGAEWHIDTVDDSWDVGAYASLALDSHGYPHISYYDRDPNGDLKYAYQDENGWHIMTVDDDYWVGLFTSIALDANNHVHISYMDAENGDLKYAHLDGSQWNLQVVDSDGVVGVWCTSLALDPNDFPHISYYDMTNGNLKYAYWDGNDWQVVTVDNDDDVGGYSSIAINDNGYPHISYLDYANARLKYAYWNGSEWQYEVVDDGGGSSEVGWYNSIALDANNFPHIAYYEDSGRNLKYAHYNGSDWEVECLAEESGPAGWTDSEGFYASIAMDAQGQPHISHFGYSLLLGSQLGLRYIRLDDTEWNREEVDHWLEFGATSIAVDDALMPHIGYIKTNRAMGYAHRTQAHWQFHSFKPALGHTSHRYGSGGFLALDANQRPHLTQQIHKSLRHSGMTPYPSLVYRWFDGNNWQQNTLYSSSWQNKIQVRSSSLVIDENDQPHISCCLFSEVWWSPTLNELKYIYKSNNQWYESIIEWSTHQLDLGVSLRPATP